MPSAWSSRLVPILSYGSGRRPGRRCTWSARAAYAALDGRDYVIPDDARALAVPVLAHRLFPAAHAAQVLDGLVNRLPLPAAAARLQ
jgi:MoxR-like ATPase